jgi:FkbM family methyltransferase
MSNFNKKKSKKTSKKKSTGKKRINKKGGSEYFDYIVGEKKEKHSGFGYDDIFKIRVASNDMVIQDALKKGYLFEKHLTMQISQYIKPGDVGLDLGTNIGCVTIPLSRMVENNGRIHSFEPFLKTRKALEYNIKVNNLKNVTLHKEAVGHIIMKTLLAKEITIHTPTDAKYVKNDSKRGKIKYVTINEKKCIEEKKQLDTKGLNNYGAVQLGKGGPMVDMITIDSLELKRVDLIKVDIEGSEPLMFYGASNTIRIYRPIIIFEHNHVKLNDDMIEIMKPSIDVQNFNIVQFCKTLGYNKIIEIESGGNYVLLPEGKERTLNDPRVTWERVEDLPKIKNFGLDGLELFKYIKNEKW